VSQHKSIRLFIRDTVKSLRDDITFSYARQSDFNALSDKTSVCVVLDPLKATRTYVDTALHSNYNIALFFFKQGEREDTEEQFALLLDDTYDIVDKFLAKLNRDDSVDTTAEIHTDLLQFSPIQVEPAIKVLADVMTGWIVTFTLTVPDKFDYCSVYDS
jgi:hypothetical protein